MENYTQLTYQERAKINMELLKGSSYGKISVLIDRSKSTISREVSRNGGKAAYNPPAADFRAQQKRKHRKGKNKISQNVSLCQYIEEKLRLQWSPKVIAKRWNREAPAEHKTSKEAIYQWIYSKDQNHKSLYRLLRRHKRKRGIRRTRPEKLPSNKVSIKDRPIAAEKRIEIGHCEVDLLFCAKSQSINVMTAVDRATRAVAIIKNASKCANVIEDALKNKLPQRLPFQIKSFTFDNGSEFARHQHLQVPAYFCAPHSPWQKGSIEKFNEQLRAYLPFRVPLDSVSQETLDLIANHINSIPREILNFRSPLEFIRDLFYQNQGTVALHS